MARLGGDQNRCGPTFVRVHVRSSCSKGVSRLSVPALNAVIRRCVRFLRGMSAP